MRDSKKLVGHLYAMFTILVWGSCFVLTKNLLAVGITAVQIIPLRMILAYVTLLVMRPRFMRLPLRDELMFILIGITGGASTSSCKTAPSRIPTPRTSVSSSRSAPS